MSEAEFVKTHHRRYVEALDMQLDLIRTLDKDPELTTNTLVSMLSDGGRRMLDEVEFPYWWWNPDPTKFEPTINLTTMVENMADRLNRSETYFVTESMMDVFDHAWKAMLEDPLRPHEIPEHNGFVFFERPMEIVDRHSQTLAFRAFSWATGEGGLGLSFWVDKRDRRDDPNSMFNTKANEDPEWYHRFPVYSLGHLDTWSFGDTWSDFDIESSIREDDDPDIVLSFRHKICATLLTFWSLLDQPLGEPVEVTDRQVRKRAKRQGFPLDGAIRVMFLRPKRRTKSGGEGEEPDEVPWSHRWMVSAHWRWQPYTKGQSTKRCPHCNEEGVLHKRILIPPHVKGPDDAPLVVKDTIKVVGR